MTVSPFVENAEYHENSELDYEIIWKTINQQNRSYDQQSRSEEKTMKKGDVLIESSNEYSDYSFFGVYVFLRDYQDDNKSTVKELVKNKIIKSVDYAEFWTDDFMNKRIFAEYKTETNG